MIVPEQDDGALAHALEPLVREVIHTHAPSSETLRVAWESVLLFLEEDRAPALRAPDATALLYAKALAACNETSAARHMAGYVPCAAPLARHLNVNAISLRTIGYLSSGVMRPVADSSLSAGLVLMLDGARLRRDAQFRMELALFPSLHALVREALGLLALCQEPGVLVFHGWASAGEDEEARVERRQFIEGLIEQAIQEEKRPVLIWED